MHPGQVIFETEKARSEMWASLIPGYQEAPRNQKKKLKQQFNKLNQEYRKMHYTTATISPKTRFTMFDPCAVQESPKELSNLEKKALPRKGNENMYVEQNMTVKEKTTEDVRREHFLDELDRITREKTTELEEKYGVDVRKSPKTPKELVEWIKAGEFSYIKGYDPESEDEDDGWCRYEHPYHGIRWTKVKEDRKGYEAAYKILYTELGKFKNEIWAELEPANFIKILEKFEKSKLH